MTTYKKLIKVLLKEIFTDAETPDYEFIEQIILRYAYRSHYLDYDKEENLYTLNDRGSKLIKE